MTENISVAVTGASGAQYAIRLIECLIRAKVKVHLLISDAAEVVIRTETDIPLPELKQEKQAFLSDFFNAETGQITYYANDDWFSPLASGTSAPKKMVVCPASGGSIAAIAMGACNSLIERAADVVIKERNQLIMVPRETPVSDIHLENMLKLSRLGCVILPASPGFYQNPKSLDDIVDFVVARILDQLDLKQDLLAPWGER